MQVEYDILTNVIYRHRYFSNLKLECFSIHPDKSSEDVMLNNGLIFKPFKDGFVLLYEAYSNGQRRERVEILDSSITLRYYLTLTDNNFFNYTDGGMDNLVDSIYYLHNINDNRTKPSLGSLLHLDEFVSKADIYSCKSFGETFSIKPFAIIDIHLNKELLTEYSLIFKEKQTYWRYVLVSEYLKNLQQPAILGEQEIFIGPDNIQLPNKQEALYFTSNIPISLSQSPLKHFKLVENYEKGSPAYRVVMRLLPTPNPANISTISNIRNDKIYSDIFIY
ncbi:MAG: hypothetical protein Q8928_10755 [Bacteroidota bacterium]|nr:hypothetical protein [Bacteroidota bacterium]